MKIHRCDTVEAIDDGGGHSVASKVAPDTSHQQASRQSSLRELLHKHMMNEAASDTVSYKPQSNVKVPGDRRAVGSMDREVIDSCVTESSTEDIVPFLSASGVRYRCV